jgi:hypothetical protein
VNRRRVVYPIVAIAAAALVIIGDRMMREDEPRRVKPTPYLPLLPGEAPGSMSPAPKVIGRPTDPPLDPSAPAMSGTLTVEPTPVPPAMRDSPAR